MGVESISVTLSVVFMVISLQDLLNSCGYLAGCNTRNSNILGGILYEGRSVGLRTTECVFHDGMQQGDESLVGFHP